jgi:hypothetical protein
MWSLDPKVRNNKVYKEMLNYFKTDLSDIPWARTGLVYDDMKGSPDQFTKGHTDYSKIIRSELLPTIERNVLSESILNLNLINEKALAKVIKTIRSEKYWTDFNAEQILLWLCSLSIFIDTYDVKNKKIVSEESFVDHQLNTHKFLIRNRLGYFKAMHKNFYDVN